MQIRDATISDLPLLADLFLTSFHSNPVYDAIYPWRASAPAAFAALMTTELTHDFLRGQTRFLIAEPVPYEPVAWASWTRNGTSRAAQQIRAENDSTLKALERTIISAHEALEFPFVRVLGLDRELQEKGRVAKRFFKYNDAIHARLFGAEMAEHWRLGMVCVHPAWRRKGVAGALVRWGCDRAREEGVLACASVVGEGVALCEKMGFVRVGVCEVEIECEGVHVVVPIVAWRPECVPGLEG